MALGIALVIFLMQVAVCAIVHDNENVRTLLRFLDIMPSFIKTALGGEMLQAGNISALVAIGYQHPLVLFLYLLYAVGVPTSLLTREIQSGGMELILSRSITKAQAYTSASLLTLGGMFALVLIMFLGTVAGTSLFDFGEPIDLGLFARIAINGGLLAGAAGSIALLCAGMFVGRNLAVTVPIGFLVASYFLWVVAQWWPAMSFLKPVTLFYYVSGPKLFQGWPWGDMTVLLSLIAIATAAGGLCWHRRDLPL